MPSAAGRRKRPRDVAKRRLVAAKQKLAAVAQALVHSIEDGVDLGETKREERARGNIRWCVLGGGGDMKYTRVWSVAATQTEHL